MDKIEQWFNLNYKKLLENTTKITRDENVSYDILQECILSFLQMPQERQLGILSKNKVENFITTCVNIQFKSSTSPYHRKYRKQAMMEVEFLDWKELDTFVDSGNEEECLECIMKELDSLHYYYRTLITDKFIKGMTYSELHQYYGISKNSLLKDIHSGLQMLKLKCEIK